MNVSHVAIFFLALVACKTRPSSESEGKFRSGEHKVLGEEGYDAACLEFKSACPPKIFRKDQVRSFSYGELVAFSGDFYGSWTDIYEELEDQPAFPEDYTDDWMGALKELVAEEEGAISSVRQDRKANYPDLDIKYITTYGLKYLELASKNVSHFGWHNLKAYVENHRAALDLAKRAHDEKDIILKLNLMMQAIFANGFADHFLTDAFAAGHIRVPRAQGIRWGSEHGYADRTISVLAKLLHDNDRCSFNATAEHICRNSKAADSGIGRLLVMNSRGDKWRTRGDGDLYRGAKKRAQVVNLPTKAVQSSVKELLNAYTTGELPAGVYEATTYVPFPAQDEISLADSLKGPFSDQDLERFLTTVGPFNYSVSRMLFGFSDPNSTRKFFDALPGLMNEFGADVRRDIASDPILARSLPEAYMTAFSNIR